MIKMGHKLTIDMKHQVKHMQHMKETQTTTSNKLSNVGSTIHKIHPKQLQCVVHVYTTQYARANIFPLTYAT
jgi:hypothetical protein